MLYNFVTGDGYTKMTQGCQCYFDESRYDCACCNPGGCQCAADHPHQCVKCEDWFMCGKSELCHVHCSSLNKVVEEIWYNETILFL